MFVIEIARRTKLKFRRAHTSGSMQTPLVRAWDDIDPAERADIRRACALSFY